LETGYEEWTEMGEWEFEERLKVRRELEMKG
jgi:hypothetical protein